MHQPDGPRAVPQGRHLGSDGHFIGPILNSGGESGVPYTMTITLTILFVVLRIVVWSHLK
jgi:hypothetical protein